MTGKGSKDKGARGEREFWHFLEGLGYEGIRRGNVFAGEPDVMGLHPFHLEVKRVEDLDLKKALRQSIAEMERKKDGTLPVVVHRKNRQRWQLTVPAEYVPEVLQALAEYGDAPAPITFTDEWIDTVIKAIRKGNKWNETT